MQLSPLRPAPHQHTPQHSTALQHTSPCLVPAAAVAAASENGIATARTVEARAKVKGGEGLRGEAAAEEEEVEEGEVDQGPGWGQACTASRATISKAGAGEEEEGHPAQVGVAGGGYGAVEAGDEEEGEGAGKQLGRGTGEMKQRIGLRRLML